MPDLSNFGLIDVAALIIFVGAVAGSLRSGGRIFGTIGAAISSALFIWLAVGALAAWGPEGLSAAATNSQVAELLPLPQQAFEQAGQLFSSAAGAWQRV